MQTCHCQTLGAHAEHTETNQIIDLQEECVRPLLNLFSMSQVDVKTLNVVIPEGPIFKHILCIKKFTLNDLLLFTLIFYYNYCVFNYLCLLLQKLKVKI